MRKSLTLLSGMLFALAAEASPLPPPNAEDLQLLSDGLSRQMRDPESMRLSDVLSADDPTSTSMRWVCGNIQGKNAFGGYANPAPFIAMMIDDPLSGQRKLQLARIADGRDQADAVLGLCQQKFSQAITAASADQGVRDDLLAYNRLRLMCQIEGGSSANCTGQEQTAERLRGAGWCIGTAQIDSWKPCD